MPEVTNEPQEDGADNQSVQIESAPAPLATTSSLAGDIAELVDATLVGIPPAA